MIKIHAICCGWLEFDRTLFSPDAAPGASLTIEVPTFLIRHDRGTVLFDSGVDCYAPKAPVTPLRQRIAANFRLRAAAHENATDQLACLGLKPGDVTHVNTSHFHVDHCGCNALFPRAGFIVQRAEMEMARSSNSRYNPAYWNHPLVYRLVNGEHDPFADGALVLMPTPGHTAGHQFLRVRAAPDVDFVPTADACYSKEHLDREAIPQAVWSEQTMIETLGTLRALQERRGCHPVFGHDPQLSGRRCVMRLHQWRERRPARPRVAADSLRRPLNANV